MNFCKEIDEDIVNTLFIVSLLYIGVLITIELYEIHIWRRIQQKMHLIHPAVDSTECENFTIEQL